MTLFIAFIVFIGFFMAIKIPMHNGINDKIVIIPKSIFDGYNLVCKMIRNDREASKAAAAPIINPNLHP